MKPTIIAKDTEHLKSLVEEEMTLYGHECDLNHIDTTLITDMSYLFNESIFNGDISQWNVSHVTDMTAMFANSHFNGNINQWNIINVTYINNIFYHSTCEKPWWAIEDNEKRKIAIDNYKIMQKLENNLSNKHITQPKKIKI